MAMHRKKDGSPASCCMNSSTAKMTDLIVGYGEVGQALMEVLKERHSIEVHDPPKGLEYYAPINEYEWMHVCIPYTDTFVETVTSYIKLFRPSHIVIHSTVAVGTTRRIAHDNITYSPVRGIHPNIARYIREFPKWFATTDDEDAVLSYFQPCGISMRRAPSIESLEWMKLFETTEYGYRIVLWQEIERQAEMPEVRGFATKEEVMNAMKEWLFEKRKVYDGDRGLVPIMFGGSIGGHCVKENWELLRPLMTPELYAWLTISQSLRERLP